jgi:hypothetical protein
MTHEMANRDSIISTESAQKLADYLGFRHFYRHSYSFFLEWSELEKLVTDLPEVWDQTRKALFEFLNNLKQ